MRILLTAKCQLIVDLVMTRAYCSCSVMLVTAVHRAEQSLDYVSLIFNRYFIESVHGSW
jgi:hypothetical protein